MLQIAQCTMVLPTRQDVAIATRTAEPHMTLALAFFAFSALALGTAIAYAIITR